MSSRLPALLVHAIVALSAGAAAATPKEDCETAISSLGYPLAGYVFEERGIFSMEKHHIGGVTCYVNINDEIDSLYLGEEVLAEDGYFGREALRERDRIRAEASAEISTARDERNTIISEAQAQFSQFEDSVQDRTERELAVLKEASNPFQGGSPDNSVAPEEEPVVEGPSEPEEPQVPAAEAPPPGEPDMPELTEKTVEPALEDNPANELIEQRYVTADRLMRRTCPSTDCGSIGALMFRERIDVLEEKGGWVRISEPGNAGCEDGKSWLIETGNADCSEANGIVDNNFALWVDGDYLSSEAPLDPAATAEADEELVKNSDDFRIYRRAFAEAAAKLISDGTCREADFRELGGWLKATGDNYDQPIYFMYCGGWHRDNRLYLHAETGRIFR